MVIIVIGTRVRLHSGGDYGTVVRTHNAKIGYGKVEVRWDSDGKWTWHSVRDLVVMAER